MPARVSKLLINKIGTVTVQLLLSRFWTFTVWPLLRFLTISRVIDLRFKQNLCRRKAKTWGNKFYDLRRTQLCLWKSQNCLSTNTGLLLSNCYCPTVTVQLLLSCFWNVTVWPLLRFLTISGVIELRFKRNLSHWKAETWGYKFYIRRTQLCLQECPNCSSTKLGLLLSRFWTFTVWPLLRFLTISRVIDLRFKQNLCRWKAKTWGNKFYDLRRTQLCL